MIKVKGGARNLRKTAKTSSQIEKKGYFDAKHPFGGGRPPNLGVLAILVSDTSQDRLLFLSIVDNLKLLSYLT